MDRTRDFLLAASRCSSNPAPRLAPTYRSGFDSAALMIADGISTVLPDVLEVIEAEEEQEDFLKASEERTLDQDEAFCISAGQKLFEATRFIAVAGREIASLDTLATKLSATAAQMHLALNSQYMAHQKGVVVVLYSRLKLLSELVAHAEGLLKRKQKSNQSRRKRRHPTAGPTEQKEPPSEDDAAEGDRPSSFPLLRLAHSLLTSKAVPLLSPGHDDDNNGDSDSRAQAASAMASTAPASLSQRDASQPSAGSQQPQEAQTQAQAFAPRREALEEDTSTAQRIERQMREVSGMIEFISSHLLEQSQDVAFILDAAVTARDNVRQGNKELKEASERPNTFRDLAVMILLLLAAILLFLDRWSRG